MPRRDGEVFRFGTAMAFSLILWRRAPGHLARRPYRGSSVPRPEAAGHAAEAQRLGASHALMSSSTLAQALAERTQAGRARRIDGGEAADAGARLARAPPLRVGQDRGQQGRLLRRHVARAFTEGEARAGFGAEL